MLLSRRRDCEADGTPRSQSYDAIIACHEKIIWPHRIAICHSSVANYTMLRRVSALAILLVSLAVLLGVESTEHSNIRRAAVHPNAYGYPADQVVFAQAKPKRVAIVGAGASGSAAAFFLRRAARVAEKRAGVESGELLGEIVVYEQEDYVGGRKSL